MEILECPDFSRGIGPGAYDIHSPLVPNEDDIVSLITEAVRPAPGERLWINPDRGLKTRGYAEVEPALRNLVAAAAHTRAYLD